MAEFESARDDVETRRLRASLHARLFGGPRQPVVVGKYVLSEPLGEGGMGTVYRAYDPDLDRRVALKLVRRGPGVSEQEAGRLVREARALARLGHPNVVAVHDAGVSDGSPYLVMELVEGSDLAAWCEARPQGSRRRTRQVLSFLEAVGDGLARAHAEGLVHRDIKPTNILVGEDGRPRLGDFGLAAMRDALPSLPESVDEEPPEGAPSVMLTRTGALLGTPAYMAPEQWEGRADAASDQFSLCATFYAALFGGPPFSGETLRELRAQIEGGRIEPPRLGGPRGIRRVLMRGLSPEPERRYASVAALLLAVRRARRRRIAVPVGVGLLAAGAVVGPWALAEPEDPCQAPPAEMAVWDEPLRARVREAIIGTGRPFAESTWTRVDERLTALRERLGQEWTQACVAARDHGAVPPGPRAACVERLARTGRFAAERLVDGDASELSRAVSMVAGVGHLTRCTTLAPAATGWEEDEALDWLEALEQGRVEYQLGRFDDARVRLEDLLAGTEGGAFAGLRSMAHTMLSSTFVSSDVPRAQEHAEAALDEAMRVNSPPLLADAWLHLANLPDDAEQFEAFCLDRIDAIDAAAPLSNALRARAHHYRARSFADRGRDEEALPWFRSAIEGYEREPDRAKSLSQVLSGAALSLAFLGRSEEAAEHGRRAMVIMDEVVGPDHPGVAAPRLPMSTILMMQGRFEEAAEVLSVAIEVMKDAGMERPLAQAYGVRAAAYHQLERFEEALDDAHRAVEMTASVFSPRHAEHVRARNRVAEVLREAGRHEEAVQQVRTTLTELAETLAEHPHVEGAARCILAESLVALGHHDDAVEEVDRVLELRRDEYAEGSPPHLQLLAFVGRVLSGAGRHARAIESLEAARERAAAASQPYWEGILGAELAWAHARAGDPRRAAEHALAARQLLEEHGGDEDALEQLRRLEDGAGPPPQDPSPL